ncbi:MAG: LacI family DNA-binding transcriptional regulator [Verrucomicrobiota bacterium]
MSEVNQQLIADRLSISRATVSRCFTNHAGISPVTRAKVFQVAAELGYTHMETRKSSRKGKSKQAHLFNVLICSDPDEYFRGSYASPGEQILAGVSEFAQTNNTRVDVNLVPPDVEDISDPAFKEIEGLTKRKSTGILLIYPFPAKVIEQLALKFPLVSLVDQLEHTSIDCVDVDHYAGISRTVEYLVEAGHRRIGFYTKKYAVEASWSFRRYGGFIEKMARMKLNASPEDVIGMFPHDSISVEESIDKAAEQTRKGVTAWVCAADHQAYDLIHGLIGKGLQIPADVSVTGFDGIERDKSEPQLTTVRIPFREIGMTGAQRLSTRMKKRFQERQHVYISGKLRAGETVAGPKPR